MNAFFQLLGNPAIISLCFGIIIGLFTRFDLPALLTHIVSYYLVFTIGFKGGLCIGAANECTPPLLGLAALGIVIGFIQPFIHYVLLEKTTKLDKATAAVVAAEYGSISIVTFITAISFLDSRSIAYDTFMPAIAGIMEIPALLSGLWIVKQQRHSQENALHALVQSFKAILSCKKISLIFVGFFVGWLLRCCNTDALAGYIIWPFNLMLILFMIDIGIKIAQEKEHIKAFSPSLFAFALFVPLINGIIAVSIAQPFAIHFGSLLLFAVLVSSASYIAVPAVMRTYVKEAKEAIYLPLSLGITLPFNILVGIPIYYYVGSFLQNINLF